MINSPHDMSGLKIDFKSLMVGRKKNVSTLATISQAFVLFFTSGRKASLSPTKGKLMDQQSNGKGAKGRLVKQQSLPHGTKGSNFTNNFGRFVMVDNNISDKNMMVRRKTNKQKQQPIYIGQNISPVAHHKAL